MSEQEKLTQRHCRSCTRSTTSGARTVTRWIMFKWEKTGRASSFDTGKRCVDRRSAMEMIPPPAFSVSPLRSWSELRIESRHVFLRGLKTCKDSAQFHKSVSREQHLASGGLYHVTLQCQGLDSRSFRLCHQSVVQECPRTLDIIIEIKYLHL